MSTTKEVKRRDAGSFLNDESVKLGTYLQQGTFLVFAIIFLRTKDNSRCKTLA